MTKKSKREEEDMAVDMTIEIMSKIVPDKRRRLNSELISPEADELPELAYNVVEGATCRQKTRLVSAHNHVFNKKKTLTSGHFGWQSSLHGECKTNTHSSASSIVNDALSSLLPTNVPTDSLPQPSSSMRKCNRLRHKHRPVDPDRLDFEIELSAITDDFLRADLHVGNKRHLVFYNDRLLHLLSSAKKWYADGTFKSVGTPFVQLWTIHVFISNGDSVKQLPIVFVLMSGKSAEDYKSVLSHLMLQNDFVSYSAS
ncbi:hypothetical protein LSH36_550g03000 [Paralvinella palmiformis]|uniref:MULE transposase domain-containing protein n=1 Tax=Paralvinella palmiformis TaxID=53620 RepID=A0AAD9J7V2_9ANNE|nr:hypothetical protein LSH36_550g03000 [Paralvinella palmiformis]